MGGFVRTWGASGLTQKELELERQSHDLARQYGRTESRDEKDKLKDKMAEVLNQQFDAQQQRRKDEIKHIEEQLKKLQELMRKREDAKREIVRRRLEQLLQEAEGLGWTATEQGPVLPPPVGGFPPSGGARSGIPRENR
jgi:hypothetical protein